MLKFSKDVMLEFCTKFFNKFSIDGTSPAEWCKAIVVLIHKGDKNRVDNYRMVSLQSVRSKFYASIVHSWLYFYVKCHCWKIKRGDKAFTQFVDIEKSFDSVQFILLQILKITGYLNHFLKKNLSRTYFCTRWQNYPQTIADTSPHTHPSRVPLRSSFVIKCDEIGC